MTTAKTSCTGPRTSPPAWTSWRVDSVGIPLDKVSDLARVMVIGHSFGTYSTLSVAGAKLDVANLIANCATTNSCATVNKPEVQAALAAGFADPRVDAVVPQSPIVPLVYEAGSLAAISVPTFMMSGRLDITTTHELTAKPTWAELDGAEDLVARRSKRWPLHLHNGVR